MKNFRLVYIPVTLMLLVGALMIGITDYITSGFSWDRIMSSEFWTNLGTTNMGIIMMILSILLMSVDNFKLNDERYLSVTDDIEKFRKSEDYSEPIFNMFCADENRENKKAAYMSKMQKKYSKLKPSAKDLEIFNGTDEVAKSNNKYCQKEKLLSSQMDPKYVDKIINKISIKYNTITAKLIFNGVATTSRNEDYITKHVWWQVVKGLAPKFLFGFAITTLISSLSFGLKDGITASVIINTASKIFTITSQIYYAISFSKTFNERITLADANWRYGKITSFKLWVKKKFEVVKEAEKGAEEYALQRIQQEPGHLQIHRT